MKSEHSTRLHDVRADLQEVQDRIQRIEDDLRSLAEDPKLANGNGNGSSDHLDLSQINDSLKEMGAQQTQEDILEAYLRLSEPFFGRAVLFLKKESHYVAWRSVGFDEGPLTDVALESDSAIGQAAEERTIVSEDSDLTGRFPWLGAEPLPDSAICMPLVFEDSSPVVLYADAAADTPLDRNSLELLTQLAVLVLKNHYLSYLSLQPPSIDEVQVSDLSRQTKSDTAEVTLGEAEENGWDDLKTSSQELAIEPREPAEGDDEPMMGGIPAFSAGDDEEEAHESESPAEGLDAAADDVWEDVGSLSKDESWDAAEDDEQARAEGAADDAIGEAEQAAQEALKHSGEPSSFVMGASSLEDTAEDSEAALDESEPPDDELSLASDPAEAAQDEAADEAFSEEINGAGESSWLKDRFSAGEEAEESAGVQEEITEPETAPEIESGDAADEAPHNEARRFARLLVSEIKLYNVDSIEQGRRDKDLYQRLQRDIDRSREMYEKRVHPSVRRETDYFHEEVLRILAAGDQDVLGGDYPGPQIEGA